MTWEEAIERLERLKRSCRDLAAGMPDEPGWTLHGMALDMALTALRPVSREQVEKVFGGKWEEETYTTVSGRGRVIHSKKCTCSACGKANGRAKTNFCPHCGKPRTPEARAELEKRLRGGA